MDNQLAPVNHVWLAAMIDGEGTITIQKSGIKRRDGSKQLQPVVFIANTNQAIIEAARVYLQQIGINPYIKQMARHSGWKTGYLISVPGLTKNSKLLPVVKPYLIGKLTQADLVLEFCTSRLVNPKGTHYSDREKEIVRMIRVLNLRGAPETEDTTELVTLK